MKKVFLRTGEKSWVTAACNQYYNLSELKGVIRSAYPGTYVYIIENVEHDDSYDVSIKETIRKALTSGVDSLQTNTMPKYFFLQIIFLTDLDNDDFIFRMTTENKDDKIISCVNRIIFH